MNKERKKMLACLAVLAALAVSVLVLESEYKTVYAEEGESISSNSADRNEEGESVSSNSAGISMFALGNSRSWGNPSRTDRYSPTPRISTAAGRPNITS